MFAVVHIECFGVFPCFSKAKCGMFLTRKDVYVVSLFSSLYHIDWNFWFSLAPVFNVIPVLKHKSCDSIWCFFWDRSMSLLQLLSVYCPQYLHLLCLNRWQLKGSLLKSGCECCLFLYSKFLFNKFPDLLILWSCLGKRSLWIIAQRLHSPLKDVQCLMSTLMWTSGLVSC